MIKSRFAKHFYVIRYSKCALKVYDHVTGEQRSPLLQRRCPSKGKISVCPVPSEQCIWVITGLCKKDYRALAKCTLNHFSLLSVNISKSGGNGAFPGLSPATDAFSIAQTILKLFSSKHNGSMTSISANTLLHFFLTCYFPSGYLSSALCLPNELKVQGKEINLSETTERQP